jgi:hypothetical protein
LSKKNCCHFNCLAADLACHDWNGYGLRMAGTTSEAEIDAACVIHSTDCPSINGLSFIHLKDVGLKDPRLKDPGHLANQPVRAV